MKNRILIGLGALAISLSLTACPANNSGPYVPPAGDDDCIVQTTGEEVDDSFCENGSDGYVWVADTGEEEEDEEEEDDDKDKKKKKKIKKQPKVKR